MGGMGGGMGGMGGGFFAVPTLPPQKELAKTLNQISDQGNASGLRTSMDQLMEVIKTTIRPDEWKGGESRIAVIGASLVVTATDDAHQQISALLDLFRQRWGSLKTVSLRAWWLWLDEDELSDALEPARGAAPMFGAVSDGAWKKLRKLATEGNRRGYSSAVTCYNGQTVFTLAGDQRLAVTGLTPVFGPDEKSSGVAYEPLVTAVHNGAVLQVTPLATRNGKYVVLDIHSRVNLVDKNSAPPRAEAVPAGDPRQVAQAIERPSLQSQRISTTLRVPVQQVTLVGGMTFGAAENRNLYLFVQGSIQELRDDDDRSAAPKIEAPKGSAGASAAPRAPSAEKPSIEDEKPALDDEKPSLDTEKPSIEDEPSGAAEAPKPKAKARAKKTEKPAAPAPSDSPFDP